MKKLILVLVLIASLLIPAGVVFGSDISTALYHGIVRVSDNGTSAADNVSTVFSLDSSSHIANGFANSTMTDVAIQYNGTDMAFMPSVNATYPWAIWVPAINAGENIDYDFYSSDISGGKLRYFPGTGGMSTTDSASLEPGDNFTIEQSGWVQTTFTDNYTDRNLVYKETAFRTYVSGAGNITSGITGIAGETEDFTTYTEVDPNGKLTVIATKITGVDVDKDEKVYVYYDMGVDYFDALDIDFEIYASSATLTYGEGGMGLANQVGDVSDWSGGKGIWVTIKEEEVNTFWVTLRRRMGGGSDNYVGAANTLYYGTLLRPAGGDTVTAEIYSDAVRETLLDTLSVSGFGTTKWRYIYGFVNDNNGQSARDWDGYVQNMDLKEGEISVIATGVSSGEHIVTVSANTTHFWIDIDGSTANTTALGGVSIPNTSANWTSFENDVMPYAGSDNGTIQQIWIDGTLQQHIEWEYDTTFTDLSGNNHDATPTFRTSASDPDVSAELISFQPVSQAQLSTFSLLSASTILSDIPSTASQMYRDLDFDNVPGAAAANEVLSEGGVPQALWWFPFLFFGIAIIGLLIYGATTMGRTLSGRIQEGQIDGSLLTMCIVIEVLFALFGIMGPLPFWPAILFPIPATALIISKKHFSWG